jgi:hypothetical protein
MYHIVNPYQEASAGETSTVVEVQLPSPALILNPGRRADLNKLAGLIKICGFLMQTKAYFSGNGPLELIDIYDRFCGSPAVYPGPGMLS